MDTQKKIHDDIPTSSETRELAPELLKIAFEILPRLTISSFLMMGLADCTLPYSVAGNCVSRIIERCIQLGIVVPKYHCSGYAEFGPSLHMDIEQMEEILCNDPIARAIASVYLDNLEQNDDEFLNHLCFLQQMAKIRANHGPIIEVDDHT
ncbi:hypothetical protein [Methanolobus bombayensis]|uniref:hypothetical protein n=1 Tax=Methanolobus bombayensis TaxID=38023 RepID=UPI001AE295D1|nr:hypothetical protein [Methanolobus bombayensis]MBP1908300.1 hypothetical protein [Methanolobus bombayensis]